MFGGLALIGFALYQYLRGRGSLVPANQFGAALTQRPGPQLRYGAPQLNETGARPVVTRGNQGVVGAVQSGAAIAIDVTNALGAIGRTFRNIFGGGQVRTPAGPFSSDQDRLIAAADGGGQFVGPGGQIFDSFGGAAFPQDSTLQNSGGFDSGGFDPDRPFDSDVFAA